MIDQSDPGWDVVIQPETSWLDIHPAEVWRYRELILLFVRRDFVTLYKQTILGPLWYVIQPLVTTVVFTIIFGRIANIPTDHLPPFLFYLSGTVLWGFFSACLLRTANTFVNHAGVFGSVYFPRLIAPIADTLVSFMRFLVQLILFLGFYGYFYLKGAPISASLWVLALPVLLLQAGLMGMGTGILISSITTKYRDMQFVFNFIVPLWMFATPIVYPLAQVPEKYRMLYALNPMTIIVEGFRYSFLGAGTLKPGYCMVSWAVTLFVLLTGVLLFARAEKTFMDTV